MICVPLGDGVHYGVDWNDMSTMKDVTCKNHMSAKYLTKNPRMRGLHFVTQADEWVNATAEERQRMRDAGWTMLGECPCPFEDLAVIVDASKFDPETVVITS